jgi:hypothetical protein
MGWIRVFGEGHATPKSLGARTDTGRQKVTSAVVIGYHQLLPTVSDGQQLRESVGNHPPSSPLRRAAAAASSFKNDFSVIIVITHRSSSLPHALLRRAVAAAQQSIIRTAAGSSPSAAISHRHYPRAAVIIRAQPRSGTAIVLPKVDQH